MKVKTRFIKSIVEAAQSEEVQMPWTRGATRSANIIRRSDKTAQLRIRTA
jgi:hypothetical protein